MFAMTFSTTVLTSCHDDDKKYEEVEDPLRSQTAYYIAGTITDANGIHARPAGLLVKEAQRFASAVKLIRGEKSADLKRLFGVMGLNVKAGDAVTVSAEGVDEEAAIQALETFFQQNL
mgnify:CR=1 FL=1